MKAGGGGELRRLSPVAPVTCGEGKRGEEKRNMEGKRVGEKLGLGAGRDLECKLSPNSNGRGGGDLRRETWAAWGRFGEGKVDEANEESKGKMGRGSEWSGTQ